MLATRANDGQAYLFVLDIHGNDIYEPTSIATSTAPTVTKLASATILFSQSGDHLIVILSGGPNPRTQVTTVYHTDDDQRTISTMPINNFILSDGGAQQTGATMPLAGTDIDRVYMAGQVGN